MKTDDDNLVRIALDHGLIRPAQLEAALKQRALSSEPDAPAAASLIQAGLLDAESLGRAVAAEFEFPWVCLDGVVIPPEIRGVLPRSFVEEHLLVPFALENGTLRVAIADPRVLEVVDTLRQVTGRRIAPAMASAAAIRRTISRAFGADAPAAPDHPAGVINEDPATSGEIEAITPWRTDEESQVGENDAPINNLVQSIIAEGIRLRASDIHLEPLERRFRVRYRIDGVMIEMASPPPKRLHPAVISRLKIMANMSIAEKRLPLDGRIQIVVAGRSLDLRVSSLPTTHGESIVMRVLDQEGLKLGLPSLGFLPGEQAQFERLVNSPDGMVLVTGPTGSGKTTTLYACLHQLNRTARKIITVEEPVEYQISGINQVPVNAAVGMTFASALRAMLRQAPNIVMVGEIRDGETAEIAINASLTGHLVFSTLHTNDAPSAVTRLVDIGAKPFLVAAALRAAVAQRLVRRNCPHCRRGYSPSAGELRAAGLSFSQISDAVFMRGSGCDACHGTGFLGRLGIFEIFFVNDGIRSLICSRASGNRLRRHARADGLRTMREDGLRKVLAGHTTIAEVVSVTAGGDEP